MTYVCFDIGGTNTRVALSSDGETLGEIHSFKTPTTPAEGVRKLAELARKLGAENVRAVSGGIRGVLTEAHDGIQNDAILEKWAGQPIAPQLSELLDGAPILLENDTALAGLGEAHFGAGQGLEIVAYHTVSTGVGGIRVVSGVLDVASVGFEPGHQFLDIDRSILGPEAMPTLENLISGTALEERMDSKPYEIPQSDVVWDELAEYLAAGLRNTTLYWSPDAIVLGGSMILGDPRIELDAIRRHTVAALDGFVSCPHITTASLGDASALFGALVRASSLTGEV